TCGDCLACFEEELNVRVFEGVDGHVISLLYYTVIRYTLSRHTPLRYIIASKLFIS
ncbi:MAG: hypothetical protein ACI8RA_002688, partial [Chlamydiales bacterium]